MTSKHPRIPKEAKLVFDGVRSRVYQWEQTMYDGSTSTFERIRFLDASFTLATVWDRIVITHQEQPARDPFVGLPGGAFDFPDEDPLLCAKRELLEETGYDSDKWIHWKTTGWTNNIIAYTHFYIARDAYKVSEVVPDPGEKVVVKHISYDEFLLLSENPDFVNWSISRDLFLARLYEEKYDELKRVIFGK